MVHYSYNIECFKMAQQIVNKNIQLLIDINLYRTNVKIWSLINLYIIHRGIIHFVKNIKNAAILYFTNILFIIIMISHFISEINEH